MREEVFDDEILFDRLVDGELPEAERRRLLASLDGRPDGWRRCALAFLEAQSWRSDLGQLVREPAPSPNKNDLATLPDHRWKPLRQGLAWAAIAASILVAFTLGVMQHDDPPAMATVPAEPSEQLAVLSPPPDQAISDASPVADALTFWVRDEGGRIRPLRVPLVDAGTLDRQLGVEFRSAVPAAIRQRLQQRGFDVQSKQRYAPLWLENGRPMIVPVEDTKIVPVNQTVY